MTAEEPGQWTGALFAERYRVGRQLDRGGMGAVYEGVRIDTGVRVAVKILHPHLGEDRYHLTRFQREAEAAAMLGHRHIVRVLDFRSADNEPAYLVMEFLEGNSLSRVVKETGPLEQRRAATVGAQVLSALSAAHAAGIVHRDLKPSNIFLAAEAGLEVAKLVDFGIAKMMEGTGYTRMTATGALVGTPAYMPPEQALGKEVDGRADIYSLGASLFVALTARPPFTAPAFSELIMKILREPAPRIAQFRPDIDPRLDAVIAQSLSKKPEERFQSADAMAHALSPWVSSGAMPTMLLPASRVPPDTSDDFDGARTSQLPAVVDRRAEPARVQAVPVAAPIPAVRGSTIATNEARASGPQAGPAVASTAASLPVTAPAGARAQPAVAPVAPVASAAPVRGTPTAFEVSAAPARRRSGTRWILVGGVIVVLGLAIGAGGALVISQGVAAPAPVASRPAPVQPVAAAPSPTPTKTDPRKRPRAEASAVVVVGPAVGVPVAGGPAVGLPVAGRADPRERDDATGETRPRRAPGPAPLRADPVVAPDERAPRSLDESAAPPDATQEPERAPERSRAVTLEVRPETFGGVAPAPGLLRTTEIRLTVCAGALGAAGAEPFSWSVDVDGSGRVLALRANRRSPAASSCVEPVLRSARFPGAPIDTTYRVTLRVR